MTITKKFAEESQVVLGVVPVDLATAANDGDWVSLKGYSRCTIIFIKGIGTAGEDPILSLQQATDVAGTGAKDLLFTVIHKKQATDITTIGTFTKTTQTAAASHTDAASAELQAVWMVEVDADSLDASNDFDVLRARVADVGAGAQIGAIVYVLHGTRHPQLTPESAIVD